MGAVAAAIDAALVSIVPVDLPHCEGSTKHGLGSKLTAKLLLSSAAPAVRPLLLALCMCGGRVAISQIRAAGEWWLSESISSLSYALVVPSEAPRPLCAEERCREETEIEARLLDTALVLMAGEYVQLHSRWRQALLELAAQGHDEAEVLEALVVASHIARAEDSGCAGKFYLVMALYSYGPI